MARIVFIHGFGENESVFKHIAPAIGGEQVFINVWNILGNSRKDIRYTASHYRTFDGRLDSLPSQTSYKL